MKKKIVLFMLLVLFVFSSCAALRPVKKQEDDEKMGMVVILPVKGELMKWKGKNFFMIEETELKKLKKTDMPVPPAVIEKEKEEKTTTKN